MRCSPSNARQGQDHENIFNKEWKTTLKLAAGSRHTLPVQCFSETCTACTRSRCPRLWEKGPLRAGRSGSKFTDCSLLPSTCFEVSGLRRCKRGCMRFAEQHDCHHARASGGEAPHCSAVWCPPPANLQLAASLGRQPSLLRDPSYSSRTAAWQIRPVAGLSTAPDFCGTNYMPQSH